MFIKRFPPCLRRSGYAQAGVKLFQHLRPVPGSIRKSITIKLKLKDGHADVRCVGKRIPRVDGISKVSGEAVYGADFYLKDAYSLKALRSPYAHAHIYKIDESEALRAEGVLTVLTWKDIPGENLSGEVKRDQPILAKEKVRYIGEPIAVVVGETQTICERALDKIKVDYEPLPAVFSPEEALKPDAPKIHEGGNVLKEFNLSTGDIEEGFSRSEIIIENTYTTPFVEHAYLEPEAGAAEIDSEERVSVYAPTQFSHYIKREIGRVLALPPERVRVVQTAVGGGFGGKNDNSVHCILALAAYKTRRPVKWTYTREESFLASTKRHASIIRYKTGAWRDGRLMAIGVDILMDTGAYASFGPPVISRAGIHAAGPYEIPNARIRSRGVYTNNPIAGAMRGFGVPQVAFAYESQMDILADRLGIDPFRLREINVLKRGSKTITGQILKESVGIGKTLQTAHMKLIKTGDLRKASRKPFIKRGVGYGCAFHGIGNTGIVNRPEVRMKLNENGKISILAGASELGQGLLTVFQQIGADALELPFEDVEVRTEDTCLTSDPGETSASKQTYMTGNAIYQTARNMIRELSLLLSRHFQVSPECVLYSKGKFIVNKDDRYIRIPFSELGSFISDKSFEITGDFISQTAPLNTETGQGIPYPAYSYGTQIAQVEVDLRTGKVRVVQIISSNDVGKAINPETVEAQIEGGAIMGLGYALMEKYVPGSTKNFREYLIPTSCDIPKILPLIVEEREPSGPFGAKGLGEITTTPTAAAIANAVSNAIGVRFYQLPLTPEQVYKAIKSDS
ncbi:MAG: xanthine dehydrogenase family protein molybdopterin-binding subunit [Thermodesulfobacteriota bacterium]